MTQTTYLVFDIAHIGDPTQTTDKAFAFADFAERQMDGDSVVLLAHYEGERPEDLTHEATEHAARVFLDGADEWSDIPGWASATDYYDGWLQQMHSARRDVKRMREQGVA